MHKTFITWFLASLLVVFLVTFPAANPPQPLAYVPTTINDFFLPGSQPLQSGTFDIPAFCDNCHGNYGEQSVEPAFNWRGSMMSQLNETRCIWPVWPLQTRMPPRSVISAFAVIPQPAGWKEDPYQRMDPH